MGHYFRQAFGKGVASLLQGEAATRGAFEERAPRVRFLHLATHAYFAPESIPSMRDEREGPKGSREDRGPAASPGGRREEVIGYAPMVLCGIAFAGANGEPTRYGRIPGVMTAEELSGLDLVAHRPGASSNLGPKTPSGG